MPAAPRYNVDSKVQCRLRVVSKCIGFAFFKPTKNVMFGMHEICSQKCDSNGIIVIVEVHCLHNALPGQAHYSIVPDEPIFTKAD